ncbi:MAG: arsenate reductase ArsC [Candidatus Omnitrophica bacterium]|nr:arsenate reductase ArsC [Candidatus Omnitrophota bacterium]
MKKVLFICVENSCRSQMAEGFAKKLGYGIIEAYSAGSRPSGEVNPDAIRVMQEEGIDISENRSKSFQELPVKEFDFVITLGCKDTCPFIPAENHIEWDVDDPKGKNIDVFRKIKDQIKSKVQLFVERVAYVQNWK